MAQELNVKEELLGLVAIKGQTRGVDIFNDFKKCGEKINIQWDKLTSVCTDAAPAITGCNVGFCAELKQFLGRTLLKYHCIISSGMALWEVITHEKRNVSGREMHE